MHINEAGLILLKSLEGCKLIAYKLKGESKYTIGYGHTDSSIKKGMTITQVQADNYLKKDLEKFENYVEKHTKFNLNENQFSALVSYTYNRGYKGFKQLMDNSNNIADVSKNIVVYWGSNENYKKSLIARRKKERTLFDTLVAQPTGIIIVPKPTLKRGSMGLEVEYLQKFLNLNNPNIHLVTDGIFGEKTFKAVQLFQLNNRLPQTGVYDTNTYNKFNDLKTKAGL